MGCMRSIHESLFSPSDQSHALSCPSLKLSIGHCNHQSIFLYIFVTHTYRLEDELNSATVVTKNDSPLVYSLHRHASLTLKTTDRLRFILSLATISDVIRQAIFSSRRRRL